MHGKPWPVNLGKKHKLEFISQEKLEKQRRRSFLDFGMCAYTAIACSCSTDSFL